MHGTAVKKFMDEVGWLDLWCGKHPDEKKFSWFCSLSSTDLCLFAADRYILKVNYALRNISDHSPLIVRLEVRPPSTVAKATLKLNAFWLHLFPSYEQIVSQITEFCRIHADNVSAESVWEVFKAVLKGIFIRAVQAIKRNTNAQREGIEWLAGDVEAEFIANPTDNNREAWLLAQEALYHTIASAAERKIFF